MSANQFQQEYASTIKSSKLQRQSLWLIFIYTACLVPFSVNGFGINYLFVVIPFAYVFSGRSLVRPRIEVTLYIYTCILVFILASIYQISWIEFFDRRLISFILYLTMFALCFVPITEKNIAAFKLSILIAGLIIAGQSLLLFISLGAEAQAFESKDVVGSQRYGFVFILAFWILWYDKTLVESKLIRVLCLLTLVMGIALTFSRASIVAFVGSSAFAFMYSIASGNLTPIKWAKKFAIGLLFIALSMLTLFFFAPIIFDFFTVRLIDYILSGTSSDAFADPETSDGTRLFIWTHIQEFILHNPLTGSGFLGVWVLNLFGGFSGSSHSQYFDALFRLGPFLFIGYIYYLLKIWQYFKRTDPGIFVGFNGILMYGLFHETFKESHGMFILAMLIAISLRRKASTVKVER
jgi:hypothetical protein